MERRTVNEHISKIYNMFRVMEEKNIGKGRVLGFFKLVREGILDKERVNRMWERWVSRSNLGAEYYFLKGFIFWAAPGLSSSMWDAVLSPGLEPQPPALRAQSLSHWATREVPEDS